MSSSTHDTTQAVETAGGLSRRSLLRGAAAAGLGVAGATGLPGGAAAAAGGVPRSEIEPFYGPRQAGITTRQQSYGLFVAFDVTTTSRDALANLLRQWTSTAEALTRGEPAPARPTRVPGARGDSGIALELFPARLTFTFGFGPRLFDARFGLAEHKPAALDTLPGFPGDQLVAAHSGGDLLVQICADDQQILSHAFLQMRALTVGVAALRWSQQGFISPPTDGKAPRNLLGLHDGTSNPRPAKAEFGDLVWADDAATPSWLRGGTYLVFRKIRLALASWSLTSGAEQDRSVGRRLADGSPLSAAAGAPTRTKLDLAAVGADGRPLIDPAAHVRQMHAFPMFRRAYNYDYGFDSTRLHAGGDEHGDEPGHGGHEAYDAGLLFATFNADPRTQFIPAQQRIASNDLLGKFMTPTASGIYAVPPGLQPGQSLGRGLL
ncbi:Dyp-type peroxidase [Motilibacter deserti]|uniref:Dyp-type peroxidase n=1 Tax=Motilibacter deserti TaxID=2714956 RepID=A0ABX0GZU2_9ACTN|nr:Dyp-type peroxidase [Motilibacter deserti]NHC15104.1 Dyp-type peroxidase [Motilibacter deserti]